MQKLFKGILFLLILSLGVATAHPLGQEKKLRDFEALKLWKLTQALDLTEDEAAELFPLLKRYSRERRQLLREYRRSLRELRELLQKDAPEDRLKEKISEVESYIERMDQLRQREWEQVKGVLSVEKQARYLLFLDRFYRDFWRILRRRASRN
ncbi:MAG: hypothetical protein DRG31_03300 [Deltaproteobacteria bacterium]|nr:MAG: hypothetical protein DRG31_03300 [Deltaproteobacteria bacterium]